MTLWFGIAALALVSAAVTLAPLLRTSRSDAGKRDHDLAVYRDQLGQLHRETALGLVPADQAQAARTEIERRILNAAEESPPEPAIADLPTVGRRQRVVLASLCALVMIVGSSVLYRQLGAPELRGQPYAARKDDPALQLASNAATLAAELKVKPDSDGFVALAQLYVAMRHFDQAADAYRQAIRLGATDGHLWAEFGEAIVMANDGMVVPEARQCFMRALTVDPTEFRSRYYLGLAEAEIGRSAQAVAIWRDLEQTSPSGAPWLSRLRADIERQAKVGGFDATSIVPSPPLVSPPEPDSEAAKLAAQGSEEQNRAIRAMVDGLAARLHDHPDDEAGWLRLARSYRVLGDFAKAVDAAHHAIQLSPKGVEPRLALAQIQLGRSNDGKLPADFIVTVRQVIALDPVNPMALFYLGRAEAESCHPLQAKRLWNKLLSVLPPQSPEMAEVEKQIATLDGRRGACTQETTGPANE